MRKNIFTNTLRITMAGFYLLAISAFGLWAVPNASAAPTPPSPVGEVTSSSQPPARTKNDKPTKGQEGRKGIAPSANSTGGVTIMSACGTCYFYAGATHNPGGGATFEGASDNMGIYQPTLAAGDYHTLAELAVAKNVGGLDQIVEVGWNIDPTVNGDTKPHLFVYRWVNGVGGTYNGSGWVDYAPEPINAGADLSAYIGTQKKFMIQRSTSEWWVAFDGKWIGYFPDTIWSSVGVSFTNSTYQQVFGEIAASDTNSCSDMGNGVLATTTVGGLMTSFNKISGGVGTLGTFTSNFATTPAKWAFASLSGSSFRYGGPGWC